MARFFYPRYKSCECFFDASGILGPSTVNPNRKPVSEIASCAQYRTQSPLENVHFGPIWVVRLILHSLFVKTKTYRTSGLLSGMQTNMDEVLNTLKIKDILDASC